MIPQIWLTCAGLLLTVGADFCLEILDPINQPVAMTAFLLVQICYCARLTIQQTSARARKIHLITRGVVAVAVEVITVLVLRDKCDYLSCVSMLYYANLILNMIWSTTLFRTAPLFCLGLWLFLGCDTFIGLQCAAGVYLEIPAGSVLYHIVFAPFNWAWFFYLPSQALIASSVLPKQKVDR